jgi:hypothetical protein
MLMRYRIAQQDFHLAAPILHLKLRHDSTNLSPPPLEDSASG